MLQANEARAAELKEEGNASFREKLFETAAESYTKALRICPLENAQLRSVLRCNRAACFVKLVRLSTCSSKTNSVCVGEERDGDRGLHEGVATQRRV